MARGGGGASGGLGYFFLRRLNKAARLIHVTISSYVVVSRAYLGRSRLIY